MSDLASRRCVPCEGGTPPLPSERAREMLGELDGWSLTEDGRAITRRLSFKGFAKAQQTANVAAWAGDREGHHPDIRFGWGYCEVSYTTHEAGGLTDNDFICAAKLDRILAG
ncbi:4a-hydroxytetrahydrobiopterin dehydratase [Paracoccus sp. S-4012]|uniref:4a-hydroxytetrahydrobiopterin dehydratase n=1 Tax=Paracoccus sp. S-4012 TaxID=2665648 RepID=UPI0012B02C02|nr:4a-hydroxytetrahydrobiopterin dehydratase [Paracoccus sp. S-4012]MRX50626.1 4a-hydroxytetrahydrobiopterin dehydratase [Paracoccus sp. S-4012]